MVVDSDKDESDSLSMVVLGMSVEWSLSFEHVRVSLERAKASQWLEVLMQALLDEEMQGTLACKMAGRLQWCLTASTSRAGRSYLKEPVFPVWISDIWR